MADDSDKAKDYIRAVEKRKQPEGGSSPEVGLQYALTDQGNGERLARQHGEDLRYVADHKKWYVWGHCIKGALHWVVDNTGEVVRRAKQAAVEISNNGGAESMKQPELDKWSHASQASSALDAMIKLARSEWPIPATPEQFDTDPWLFAVQNGTINLRTGEFYESRREDLLTKCTGVKYVPSITVTEQPAEAAAEDGHTLNIDCNEAALCPTWESFLHVVMDDDEEMIEFLQRCVGYSMTGLVKERVLLILYGGGANGKSTFVETLHSMLGDYATVTPIDTLLAKKFGSSIPNDIAALKGVRFVSASETDENAKLATGKIKGMTGGGRLSARFMGGEFFNFQTTFKLWLETNHKPRIDDSSKAMFDRIRLIPFKVRIPEEKQDKELKLKLLAELSGILNWALAGVKQYQEIGLAPPAKVVEETARYQREQDVLGTFLADRYEEKTGAMVSKDDFYKDWVDWCKHTGEFAITKKTLGHRMNDRNFEPDKRSRITPGGKLERVWEGLCARVLPVSTPRPGTATLNYSEDDL